MLDKVAYWLELADDDMIAANLLLKGGSYLQAGFFCHLITEKALKAVISDIPQEPPKIHDLIKLAKRGGIYDDLLEKQRVLLEELDPLNIEARYPEYKARIAKTLNKEKLERIYKETGEFLCWIKQRLGK